MESFFASLALFLSVTVSVRWSGSDDAISGDLNWMFDSLFDDMACSGRCCRVAQLNFWFGRACATPHCVGRAKCLGCTLDIPVRCLSFLREHRSPDG